MQEVHCAIFSEVQVIIIPVLPAHQTTIITAAAAVVPIQVLRAAVAVGEVRRSVSFKELRNLSAIWQKGFNFYYP